MEKLIFTKIFKWFWLICIFVNLLNVLVYRFRAQKYIKENPELEEGYKKIFKGFIVFANIPWIIMGIGNLSNYTSSLVDYLRPHSLNPVVILFYFSVILIIVLGSYWIYFKNGAEFLEKHRGIIRKRGFSKSDDLSAKQIKLFWGMASLGGIAALILLWFIEVPPLDFLVN